MRLFDFSSVAVEIDSVSFRFFQDFSRDSDIARGKRDEKSLRVDRETEKERDSGREDESSQT